VLRHAGYGGLLGTVPLLISLMMEPSHRSPYLLAYPAVILSAWVWGLSASVACGAVSGFLLEYFIFHTHQISLAPIPNGWVFREIIFLGGSVMVGALTRSAARQRQESATANLNQRVQLAEVEAAIAIQKAVATELELENEVRSRLALDGANAGLWEWDIAAQKSKWSHGFYRLHGLEPGTPINYDVRRECLHPEDFDRVELTIEKAIAEGCSFLEEYRVLLPGGGIRWVACQGTAITGPDGRVVKVSGFGGDVTRRKLADLALLHNEKMAIAGRLIATIAHEINNPLDAVMNMVYLLRHGVPEDEQSVLLDETTLQLERISQISRQTLNFSRTSVRATLSKPSALVDEALRLLRPKLRLAQIEAVSEVRSDSDFYCERREAQQILTNILNNAIDAMQGPGTLRVRIADSVDWRHRKQRGIRITIADTGVGMSRSILQRISEPFFTTKESTGTGLGMWVVHELIKKQNGTISISSSTAPSHHGTAVSLFIPFAVGPTADSPPTRAIESHAAL
jgi:PAS domain S-box-containing protein